nr:MAG TPA: hypothetical protein [Caudoviricetes sp.]DAN09377.1 MAG TPA: hypothetical protein [Caudoviricetes sp.]DAP49246.1 MAG TPA: hypothetical protein [Caudoviricetes sp.]DAZ34104.1 MAG TPA: hypothetical protein [Caudoviricetes sp.]
MRGGAEGQLRRTGSSDQSRGDTGIRGIDAWTERH